MKPEYTNINSKPNMDNGDLFGDKNIYITKNATLTPATPVLACYCELQSESMWDIITNPSKNHTIYGISKPPNEIT